MVDPPAVGVDSAGPLPQTGVLAVVVVAPLVQGAVGVVLALAC